MEVSFTHWPLYFQERAHGTHRKLDGYHSASGRGGEERKFLPRTCTESNSDHPSLNLVTILPELQSWSNALIPVISHALKFITSDHRSPFSDPKYHSITQIRGDSVFKY
jgi:hypothetical protein